MVHNVGRRGVYNAKIKIRVKGLWDDFKTLNLDFPSRQDTFSLDPDEKLKVRLCQVALKNPATVIHILDEFPALETGKTWELEVRFWGRISLIGKYGSYC